MRRRLTVIFLMCMLSSPLVAKETVYSFQALALAPNAGGQSAYALHRATEKTEWTLFANHYLRAADQPLVGGIYSWRFPAFGSSRGAKMVLEGGAGISSVGPMIELLWSATLLWSIRLDVASHFYVAKDRVILWSYPLWIGLSVSI